MIWLGALAVIVLLLMLSWHEPGHALQTRIIFDHLPPGLRTRFSTASVALACDSWSHYPDSFEPIDLAEVGEATAALLAREQVGVRYAMHHDRPRGLAFLLLIEALRRDREREAAFWLAVLGHSIGDMSAANHDPFVHRLQNQWTRPAFGARLPDGRPAEPLMERLHLEFLHRIPNGPARLASRTRELLSAAPPPNGLGEALVEVMMCGFRGGAVLSGHALGLVRAVGRDDDAEAAKNLVELGAWSAAQTVRFALAAAAFARQTAGDVLLQLSEAHRRFLDEAEAFAIGKALEQEEAVKGVPPLLETSGPVVAVAYEPLWRMNASLLGFESRAVVACVAQTLRRRRIPVGVLDVRDLIRTGVPDPDRIAALVVAGDQPELAPGILDRARLYASIREFAEAGGNVIWLGGSPEDALPRVTERLREGQGPMGIAESALTEAAMILPDGVTCRVEPETAPIRCWCDAGSPWVIEAPEAQPLLRWRWPGGERVVGAVWRPSPGQAHALLPAWTLWTRRLGDHRSFDPASLPALDPVGERIFLDTLRRVAPAIAIS